MLELIINKNKDIQNIILTQNGKMIENYTTDEKTSKKRIEGNIYVGIVNDIISGMQAAFIDFGEEKNGFIHLKDAVEQIDETKEKLNQEILDIKKILKPKQKLLVQIKKDSDNKKGARISTHVSIPGKYVVLMPNTNFITISQKIEDENSKKELKKIVKNKLPKGYGAVLRTASKEASYEEIEEDINLLLNKWKTIEDKFQKSSNEPQLLFESEDIIEKILIDLSGKKLEKIETNDKKAYEKLVKILKNNKNNINIELKEKENLLNKYSLEKQLQDLEKRKIWLNCGGFITIDKTEALTAIDVNTGKFTGKQNLENTVFKVNKEATIEIAKQLRLRDIGGIIIIDYIDMKSETNKEKIQDLLKQVLKEDRAKTQVEGFTKLNLMEMTRKHVCTHLSS